MSAIANDSIAVTGTDWWQQAEHPNLQAQRPLSADSAQIASVRWDASSYSRRALEDPWESPRIFLEATSWLRTATSNTGIRSARLRSFAGLLISAISIVEGELPPRWRSPITWLAPGMAVEQTDRFDEKMEDRAADGNGCRDCRGNQWETDGVNRDNASTIC